MTKEIELTLGEWNDFRRGYHVLHCAGVDDFFGRPLFWSPMGNHQEGSLSYKTVTVPYLFTVLANCAVFTVKESATV